MSCTRCGGFKVVDYFYGTMQCDGYRCVNCGAITDIRVIMPVTTPRSIDSVRRFKPKARPVESAFANTSVVHANEIER
jgi:hypothetical protein